MTDDLAEDAGAPLFTALAAAYVRGVRPELALPDHADDAVVIAAGRAAGLRLHPFKRTMGLARVERVLSILAGMAPDSLLDIGSGRGAFLWPLLDRFPSLPVTALEPDTYRYARLAAVARGGLATLTVAPDEVAALPFADNAFDGATVLEVLEHLVDPVPAARSLVRVCRRFVIASVPSQPDDNPEHLRLFSATELQALWREAGARRVTVQHVRGHRIAVAML